MCVSPTEHHIYLPEKTLTQRTFINLAVHVRETNKASQRGKHTFLPYGAKRTTTVVKELEEQPVRKQATGQQH